ncbi:MAG: DUF2066 domain-containing protein [Rickettsiales bacterium]|nr:DUF2066 domain-containing protein [Rickettsiales bacterium]
MQELLVKIFVIFCALGAFSAQAIEVEVKVFEKGVNAMEARSKALANAEKRGFAALVKQKAPDRATQIMQDYKGYNISQYILGYHAKKEVVTDTSYRAVLVLDFDDQFVTNALLQTDSTQAAKKNTPEDEPPTVGNAVLLLPVLRGPKGVLLWEPENLWRRYVNEMILQRGSGQFVAPYGDPTDKLSLSASNVTTANFSRLAPLANRYGANRALIAILHERGVNGFGLTLREISPRGDTLEISHIEPEADLTAGQLLRKTAKSLIDGYLKKQERANAPEQALEEQVHEIEARITLNNARDWGDLRSRLQNIAVIDDTQVLGADASGMTLKITFRGAPKEFGQALINNGVSATQNNDQLWLALR